MTRLLRATRRLVNLLCLMALLLPPSAGAASARTPVLFDHDMAIDDWTALLYLARHPELELLAVTVTGAGEAHCAAALRQLPRLLDLAEAPATLPYACGDAAPLDGYFVFPAAWRRDADTLSGVELPASARQPDRRHPAELLHAALARAARPPVVVATGPLTNIAQWFDRYPQDRQRIARLVIMGGALDAPGNIIVPGFTDGHPNRVSEWNLYIDPLAAQQVLHGTAPITLVPLDATNKVRVSAPFAAAFQRAARSAPARFVAAVFERNRAFIDSGEYYFWDVLAALVAADPALCQGEHTPLAVSATPHSTGYPAGEDADLPSRRWDGRLRRRLDPADAGQTRRAATGPAHRVCTDTDAATVFRRFTQTLN